VPKETSLPFRPFRRGRSSSVLRSITPSMQETR
jgi:hypothetical protein